MTSIERLVYEESRRVIGRWSRGRMLRFSAYDAATDDLTLASEIARRIAVRLQAGAMPDEEPAA